MGLFIQTSPPDASRGDGTFIRADVSPRIHITTQSLFIKRISTQPRVLRFSTTRVSFLVCTHDDHEFPFRIMFTKMIAKLFECAAAYFLFRQGEIAGDAG